MKSDVKHNIIRQADRRGSEAVKPEQWKSVQRDITANELLLLMDKAGLPIFDYKRTGDESTVQLLRRTRSIRDLQQEVAQGISVLRVNDKHELKREVNFVRLSVCCRLPSGAEYILQEDHTELTDGTIKHSQSSVSLKGNMIGGEDREAAAMRLLDEELRINALDELGYIGTETTTSPSHPQYPGLASEDFVHSMVAYIPERLFASDGYAIEHDDETVFYTWEQVPGKDKNL